MKIQRRNLLLCPSHFPPQPLTPNLHPAEGKPFLAQVFQRGPDIIDGIVDAEEAVVCVVELSQNLRQLPHKEAEDGSVSHRLTPSKCFAFNEVNLRFPCHRTNPLGDDMPDGACWN